MVIVSKEDLSRIGFDAFSRRRSHGGHGHEKVRERRYFCDRRSVHHRFCNASQRNSFIVPSDLQDHVLTIRPQERLLYEIDKGGYYCVIVPDNGVQVTVEFSELLDDSDGLDLPRPIFFIRLAGLVTLLVCIMLFARDNGESNFATHWCRGSISLLALNVAQITPAMGWLPVAPSLFLCTMATTFYQLALLGASSVYEELFASIWATVFSCVYFSETNRISTYSIDWRIPKLAAGAVLLATALLALARRCRHAGVIGDLGFVTAVLASVLSSVGAFYWMGTVDLSDPLMLSQFGFGTWFVLKELANTVAVFGSAITLVYAFQMRKRNERKRSGAARRAAVEVA